MDDDLSTDNGNDEQLGVQGEDLKGDHETEEDMAEQPDNESYEGDGILPFPSEAAPFLYCPLILKGITLSILLGVFARPTKEGNHCF